MPVPPLNSIRGIGPAKAEVLKAEASIETLEDLLYYSPRKYIDRTSFKPIVDCFENETVTVSGIIESAKLIFAAKKRFEVKVSDQTDSLTAVFFGGLNFFPKVFTEGDEVIFWGKISFFKNKQMVHPEFDFADISSSIQTINTGRIVPLYRSGEKLKFAGFDSRGFRRIIKSAIEISSDTIEDPLPADIILKHNLISLQEALRGIHFPDSFETADKARKRLAFNEAFFLHSYFSLTKKILSRAGEDRISVDRTSLNGYISRLPFQLTSDQKTALNEIVRDMESTIPMNRLLQGDVGCGKTVIAFGAAVLTCSAGGQAAIMAPTGLLASQHYETGCGILPENIKTALLTGSTGKKDRESILTKLACGEIDILIGTHALIQEDINFQNLKLIVIDEQHRFGVEQRTMLREKGNLPHLLVMTATPIPRSLSLTIYGDLDVSFIRTKPAGRAGITTLAFPDSRLNAVYNSIRKYTAEGRQVYYVLPLIDESEKSDLKSATETYNKLLTVFPEIEIALLHGRLKPNEKKKIMDSYRKGELHMLVTTTVIEVGVDVPNASVMVIEHAERFGLAQLHQLRGRIGRGIHKSFCVLIHPERVSDDSLKRINTLVENTDGFIIAEEDLKQRGAGDLIGTKQHGRDGGFDFLDISSDYNIILSARESADDYIKKIGITEEMLANHDNLISSSVFRGFRIKRLINMIS